MTRKRITLVLTSCQRCGKPLYTAPRSLLGLDSLKAKWGSICEACFTPDEQWQMLHEQGQTIVERRR